MRVLVVARPGQICDALERQFKIRRRSYAVVDESCFVDDQKNLSSDVELVINVSSLQQVADFSVYDHESAGSTDNDNQVIDSLAALAQYCADRQIPLIHLSSSSVYDGLDSGVHRETESPVPVSRSAGLQLRLEELLKGICSRYILLRTGPLFSSQGDNLLTHLLDRFRQGGDLQLSDRSESCPIHSSDLARVISAMIDQLSCDAELWGTYHYCSADYVSHYQFAEVLMQVVKEYSPERVAGLELSASEEADDHWRRPLLNCEKILNTFGIKQLPWRAFVAPTIKRYLNPDSELDEPVLSQSIATVKKENFS